MKTQTAPKPASDKQIALIHRLAQEKDISSLPQGSLIVHTMQGASALIDTLFKLPKLGAPSVAEGFYLYEGDIYRVVMSKASGNLYAKRMVIPEGEKGRWQYAPGMVKTLVDAPKVDAEQAGHLGRKTGVCMICGAFLTDSESVARGIGPVCAAKL